MTTPAYRRYLRIQRVLDREITARLIDASLEAERILRDFKGPFRKADVRKALEPSQVTLWDKVDEAIALALQAVSESSRKTYRDIAWSVTRHLRLRGYPRLASRFDVAAKRSIAKHRPWAFTLSRKVYISGSLRMVEKQVALGLRANESPDEIAQRVRALIRPDVPGGVSYAAKRLARTEVQKAHHFAVADLAAKSPYVVGLKWTLSLTHKGPDVCDRLADANPTGLGKGIYTVDRVPAVPHPHCLCQLDPAIPNVEAIAERLLAGMLDDWIAGDQSVTFTQAVG